MMNEKDETFIGLDLNKRMPIKPIWAAVVLLVIMLATNEPSIFEIIKTRDWSELTLSLTITIIFWALFKIYETYLSKRAITFNSSGIIDRTHLLQKSFIPWSEINGHEIQKEKGREHFVIKVKNPDKFLTVKESRLASSYNIRLIKFGSPIVISSTGLKTSFLELESLFKKYLLLYGEQGLRQTAS